MEQLNLEIHDPEEYQGKFISYNSCNYIVGDYVGSGVDKFIHRLINEYSGLTLHIIKIYRSEEAEGRTKNEVAVFAVSEAMGFNNVPEIIVTELNGHKIAIEEYLGPYENETSPCRHLMKQSEAHLAANEIPQAIGVLNQVLSINPNHTVAINNLSYCLGLMKRDNEAYGNQLNACIVEPNYSEYRKNLIEYAAHSGKLASAVSHFNLLRQVFPHYNRIDDLMARIFIAVGLPERIKELQIFSSKNTDLIKSVNDEMILKEKACEIVTSAKSALYNEDFLVVSKLLKEAYNLYNKIPLQKFNLALCLYEEKHYNDAMELLSECRYLVNDKYLISNLMLTAFCYSHLDNIDLANKYIEAAFNFLENTHDADDPITLDDIPGIGIWVDEEGILENTLESSYKIISNIVNNLPKEKVSNDLRSMLELYAQASTLQNEQYAENK